MRIRLAIKDICMARYFEANNPHKTFDGPH